MTDFIHLNVHSSFSKGWGIGFMEDLCLAARGLGMDRLAITDTNGLHGLIFFLRAARETGISPIVGSEISAGDRRAVLLVRSHKGYANLCRIISDRKCHKDFDLVDVLRGMREGLIIFSDDFRLLKALKKGSMKDLFVEMSPGYNMHRCLAFSRSSGIPPLATNRVYMVSKEQFGLHRILRAVDLNSKLSRLRQEDFCREHNFLNSARSMIDQFPHAPDAIENSVRVGERCMKDWDIFRLTFPDFEGMSDREAFDRLYNKTMQGCRRRYGNITKAVRDRVDHEMAIIRDKNFSHYFLVVADLAEKASRSCGRGSSAASIVSYALGITDVDPIKHDLFFERFLNPGRVDPPDIDIDFAWDEREQILDYIFARHGNQRAAMVGNHNTFGTRSAIREVAKVYGLTEQEIGRVTARIGFNWSLKNIRNDIKDHPKMRGIEFNRPWDEIIEAAARLEEHFNHLSVHCGGVVIVPDDIRRYCPVEISANGVQVLQWEKDSVEDSGLVKIDILGNRSLAVIRDTLALVERNHGLRIDRDGWDPINDPETARIFYRGDTFGVFYFESPATRQVLTKVASGFTFAEYLKLDHFFLNVVVTSIIRPASNQSIRTWVSRLHGQPWSPPHPLLMPVLEETLGVMVFQEQLSQAAIHMAGFDAAEADSLRKVVSKKHREKRLRDFHDRFIRGATERGVAMDVIEDVWRMMMGFDGYSFCKPHSASYTMVAYKSAYLRAHYPAEFMASVISNGGGYYSTFGYISEARRMGLRILPPDINLSEIKYTGKDKDIRVGLMQIKGLSKETAEAIIDERKKNGPFTSIEDLLGRTGRNLRLQDARILIKAGCFDSISGDVKRSGLVWKTLRFFDDKEEIMAPGLFDYARRHIPAARPSPYQGSYSREIMLRHESETLGLLLSIHPLELYADVLKGTEYVRASDMHRYVGSHITMIGWLVTSKTVLTKEGEPMKFVSFEDGTGIYETVFFPNVYHRYCHMFDASRPYVIKGRVEDDFGSINLDVQNLLFLDLQGENPYTSINNKQVGAHCNVPLKARRSVPLQMNRNMRARCNVPLKARRSVPLQRTHHRRSIRLKGYDYSQPGAYFITICAQNKELIFGDIIDGNMHLNESGKIVEKEWSKTFDMRKNLILDVYVIMPNHFHGIIIIDEDGMGTSQRAYEEKMQCRGTSQRAHEEKTKCRGTLQCVQEKKMQCRGTLQCALKGTQQLAPTNEKFGKPASNSIPTIIRLFKSATTKQINQIRQSPGMDLWQRNYYEHVIRNEDELNHIREYIINNPLQWQFDRENPKCRGTLQCAPTEMTQCALKGTQQRAPTG